MDIARFAAYNMNIDQRQNLAIFFNEVRLK